MCYICDSGDDDWPDEVYDICFLYIQHGDTEFSAAEMREEWGKFWTEENVQDVLDAHYAEWSSDGYVGWGIQKMRHWWWDRTSNWPRDEALDRTDWDFDIISSRRSKT